MNVKNLAQEIWMWNDCPNDKNLEIWTSAEKEFNNLNELTKKTAYVIWLIKSSKKNNKLDHIISMMELITHHNLPSLQPQHIADQSMKLPNEDIINWNSAEEFVMEFERHKKYVYLIKIMNNNDTHIEWVLANGRFNKITFIQNELFTNNIHYKLIDNKRIDTSFNLSHLTYYIIKDHHEYECSICYIMMNELLLLNCKHVICSNCNKDSLQNCPFCREPINKNSVIKYYIRIPI